MSNDSTQTLDRMERWLVLGGLVVLAFVPLAYCPFTYEKAYLKTFLFRTAGMLLFGGFLLAMFQGSVYRRRPFRAGLSLTGCMVAWLIWNLATTVWSSQMTLALERFAEQCLMVALAIGTAFALHDPRRRLRCLQIIGIILCPVGLYTIWVYAQPYEQRLPNLFSNRNVAGPFYYLPAAVAVAFASAAWRRYLQEKNWKDWKRPAGPTVPAVIFLLVIASTQSVAALICLVAVLPAGILLTTRQRRHLVWGLPAVVLLFVLATSLVSNYTLKDLQGPISTTSLGLRLHFWEATWSLFWESPAVGVGAGNYVATIPTFRSVASYAHPLATPALLHAHCHPLEVLTELGPLGLGLLVWLWFEALSKSYRIVTTSRRTERVLGRGLFAGFLAMLAHSLVGVAFSYTEAQAVFWIGIGLLLSIGGLNTDTGSLLVFGAVLRASFVGGLGLLLTVSWGLAGLNTLRAQFHLSRGIAQKRALLHMSAPVSKLTKLADRCQAEFEKAMSMSFAGRAFMPAANHLAAFLSARAEVLATTPLEKYEVLATALEVQELANQKYPDYGTLNYNLAALANELSRLTPDGALGRSLKVIAFRYARRQLSLNPFNMSSYALWLRASRSSRLARSYSLARAYNSKALKFKPDDVDLNYVGMVLLHRIGRPNEVAAISTRLENQCRQKLEELGDQGSKKLRLKYLLYLVELIHASKPEEARGLLRSALELNPSHPKAIQLQEKLRRQESSLPYSDFVPPD